MRPFALAPLLLLASCLGREPPPAPEEVPDGQRECWVDEECVIVREVSGCCASCAGVVPLAVAESQTCLVEAGEDAPAACFEPGCAAAASCARECLDPVGTECVAGRCLAVFDCSRAEDAPAGTFCDE